MPYERNYYVICDDNCKFPAMTAEQVLAAIAEATGNTPTSVDDAFITKIREQNANNDLKFWVGTQAAYNALTPENNVLYIITDSDDTLSVHGEAIAALEGNKENKSNKITSLEGTVTSEQYPTGNAVKQAILSSGIQLAQSIGAEISNNLYPLNYEHFDVGSGAPCNLSLSLPATNAGYKLYIGKTTSYAEYTLYSASTPQIFETFKTSGFPLTVTFTKVGDTFKLGVTSTETNVKTWVYGIKRIY